MTTLLLVSMYNDIACIWVASDFFWGLALLSNLTPGYNGSDRALCHDIAAGLLNIPKHAALFAATRACYRRRV